MEKQAYEDKIASTDKIWKYTILQSKWITLLSEEFISIISGVETLNV